jgi:uncharacterized repeat protein (TIGR01451 family)
VGSYDPNDKQVYPQGRCDAHYTLLNETLTYTVRFQNTGTALAQNVFVLDTLDTHLDIHSVSVVGTSHEPVLTEVMPGNVLKFRFDNIALPDSNTNEYASQGYVVFGVKPVLSTPENTLLSNSASIYFDYNEPVKTNSVFTTLVTSFPAVYTLVVQSGNMLSAVPGGDHYQWLDCATLLPVPGATGATFNPNSNGGYAYAVTQSGCTDTSACYEFGHVGLYESSRPNGATVYPNPTDGNVVLTVPETFRGTVDLVDVLGRVERSYTVVDSKTLMVTPTTAGMYVLKLISDTGDVTALSIIKR